MSNTSVKDVILNDKASISIPVVVIIVTFAISLFGAHQSVVNRLDRIEEEIKRDRFTRGDMIEWVLEARELPGLEALPIPPRAPKK